MFGQCHTLGVLLCMLFDRYRIVRHFIDAQLQFLFFLACHIRRVPAPTLLPRLLYLPYHVILATSTAPAVAIDTAQCSELEQQVTHLRMLLEQSEATRRQRDLQAAAAKSQVEERMATQSAEVGALRRKKLDLEGAFTGSWLWSLYVSVRACTCVCTCACVYMC